MTEDQIAKINAFLLKWQREPLRLSAEPDVVDALLVLMEVMDATFDALNRQYHAQRSAIEAAFNA